MTASRPTVFIVDDERAFAESVAWLLSSVNLETELFDSAQSFLEGYTDVETGCVIADIRMPEVSGLELQELMQKRGIKLPFIVMTAHGDVDTAVLAMKRGAFDFVQKPFNDQSFIDIIEKALSESVERAEKRHRTEECRKLISSLTAREREILDHVVDGKTNRAIAKSAGISEKTVEAHRASIMSKTGAGSLAELVRIALRAR